MQDIVMIPLSCDHYAIFTTQSILQNGVPSRWWCPRCRITSDVMTNNSEISAMLEK